MLIICPECGKEISDKSKQCIYCGFPLDELQKNIDEKELTDSKCPMCGVQKKHIIKDNIKEACAICGYIFNEEYVKNHQELLPTPKCPKCGSTAIQMVPRKFSLLTGFATNKVDRVCVNCKHKW